MNQINQNKFEPINMNGNTFHAINPNKTTAKRPTYVCDEILVHVLDILDLKCDKF
jgi:hypothetical protein